MCKFYQGSEDKDLELKLKKMFGKVHREKPESSRNVSLLSYFFDRIPPDAELLHRNQKKPTL